MPNYYILIKTGGEDRSGNKLDARSAALQLVSTKLWPLYEGTQNRNRIAAGDKVLVYAAGSCLVIASATVSNLVPWSSLNAKIIPIEVDGLPVSTINLADVEVFSTPISLRPIIERLSFLPKNPKKWGAGLMGGTRAISKDDYILLGGKPDVED